ncbi:phosphocholine cytidylyltransferase family protein [Lichenicoccus roseus]|uniref:Nucleotidyltransferase n=1 Tax=Lichenicoccus roseus TaxID=2683649 RepID=A0A5R9J433_9PROT|nr:NTP transferase domain-containing protein [Lichenicoccus roseus]TLU71739.1 nucleotidyltransferase [Lichenicoccus roseus]
MKCLIVAAGQGARLRVGDDLKPLVPVAGIPLIEQVIDRAVAAGIDEFFVVSGYRGEELRSFLDGLSARNGTRISHIVNTEWQRANGVSLLKAKGHFEGPFLLTMCDHLVDPAILRDMMTAPHAQDSVVLGVDYNITDPINDPEDVTRVASSSGRITAIGKLIAEFDCYDTGVFLCGPAMFDALEESQANGDDSISGAMNALARHGRALVFDIGDRVWIDVDDPVALGKAEALLASGRL